MVIGGVMNDPFPRKDHELKSSAASTAQEKKIVPTISRRKAIERFAFYGAAMALAQEAASAQAGSSGSFSTAAVALPVDNVPADSNDELAKAVKISRATRAGPLEITRNSTIAEMDRHGNLANVLRPGTNEWICVPGDENRVGDPPMCVDQLGLQWFKDIHAGKPAPTNTAPGLCYMLCGATQHSNDTPFDRTSPAIPIGPHWMVLWPFDAKHCGLPTTVRDAGAWIMFSGTPYAYLHICGTPWDGNEYSSSGEARWTMQYAKART
jgi:hypothetical protein